MVSFAAGTILVCLYLSFYMIILTLYVSERARVCPRTEILCSTLANCCYDGRLETHGHVFGHEIVEKVAMMSVSFFKQYGSELNA
jgi:hypothetical protein